jgi:hypothetical protein
MDGVKRKNADGSDGARRILARGSLLEAYLKILAA